MGKALVIRGVGICAAGLPDWARASRVLAGLETFEPELKAGGSVDELPITERRRINEISRLACLAAADALATHPSGTAPGMPTIFTSSDGDGVVLRQLLNSLAQPHIAVSPTAFHNSVYNAPAGYWTIAQRSTAPSTTLCADRDSFSLALLEAYAQVSVRQGPVLVVAVDAPFPNAIQSLGTSAAPFACAIVLDVWRDGKQGPSLEGWIIRPGASAHSDDPMALAYTGNAAAAALPLLSALARSETARIELPYFDGAVLEVRVVPC